ncbi:plasmid replication protein RepC [Methylobacterium ajmalii]|jgi:replication initiation protein RepC|uniref:Plasmid replication protein RepC n=1 Tax=Methylobacterium ajmalii TaxID=2738439 RepID=A0ABV0A7U3_9HYPH|nr:plasmid replication protein RepC [uncultured Methylobacterium sp.]
MTATRGSLGEAARRITTPFGGRALTAAQVAAQADATGRPAGIVAEKWRVLHDLTAIRVSLGLSAATLVVLEALLTFHPETMLAPDPEADSDLVVFPSNRTLAARARGLSEAALRRHLSALVEAGLVIRRDSPNGKRYARRGEGGQVTHAFGFDLTPLAVRAEEFAGRAAAVRAEALALSIAREKVSLLRRDCAKLLDALIALDDGVAGEPSAQALHAQYRALLAAYPRRPEPVDVMILGDGLEALALAVSSALIARAESTKTSGNAAHSERHKQNSNPNVSDCEPASGDAQKESAEPESGGMRQAAPEYSIRSTYPLRSVLEVCPQVLDFAPAGVRSWQDLIETTGRIRPMLGISPTAWSDAQEAMGQEAAAITLAAILERHDSIKNAGGYLRSLTERKRAGKYSLGPVLQALRRARLRPRNAA